LSKEQINNPLHGKTLGHIVNELVDNYGWVELGACIYIRCFNNDPTVKSSLKFLRKNEWARNMVEKLYLNQPKDDQPNDKFKWKEVN